MNRSQIVAMRLIFWGVLIWVIDIQLLTPFDILSDPIGLALVACGQFTLIRRTDDAKTRRGFMLAWGLTVLAMLGSIGAMVPWNPAGLFRQFEAVALIAMIIFSFAMRRFVEREDLPPMINYWRSASCWMTFTYVPMMILVEAAYVWSLATGASMRFDGTDLPIQISLGIAACLFVLMLIPLVQFLSAVHHTREALDRMPPATA